MYTQGELVEEGSIHRSAVVECMQWHPEKKLIAIGWRSGEITTYNDTEHAFFEQSSIHRAAVSVMRWNNSGTRLVTGDKVGLDAMNSLFIHFLYFLHLFSKMNATSYMGIWDLTPLNNPYPLPHIHVHSSG